MIAQDAFSIAELTPEVAELLGSMTFPAYRHLLALAPARRHADIPGQRVIQPLAIAAWTGAKAVGLLVAEMPIESAADGEATPELLSLFVLADWRARGVGTALVAAFEDRMRAAGFGRVSAVWMTGRSSVAGVERILEKRGWEPPKTRTISVRFTPEEAARTPWFQRVKLPADRFEIFSWSEIGAAERDEIRRSHEAAPWIAKGLEPWDYDVQGFDPISSVGLRYEGTVVGWVINHRTSDDCVRFTCSFMRSDLSRRGRILPLYTEAIQRLAAAGIKECTFVTPLEYAEMAEFVRRRCPGGTYAGETRGSMKSLAHTQELT
jgi:GNAT superfamily N-acetyltransferase